MTTEERILPLDVTRGAAIMGILLMNIILFGLPRAALSQPDIGGSDMLDRLIWLAEFVLIDGKIRALLAMLFGASALLVIDRAEMAGKDGFSAQRRRLLTLILIGVLHYLLLWEGDILILLGIAGLIALRLVSREPLGLLQWAFAAFGVQLLILILLSLNIWQTSAAGYSDLLQRSLVHDIALHRGSYGAIAADRLLNAPTALRDLLLFGLPEMIGFMLLGMAMAKGGFFFAQWTDEQYGATARRAYAIGLPILLAIGLWALWSDDARTTETLSYVAAFPLRIPVAIGHAALIGLVCARLGERPWLGRVAAIGRLALSNYLLCSILMTALFYGYGANLYARLDRLELFGIALLVCAGMLLWSPLWLRMAGRGPAERLWAAMRR